MLSILLAVIYIAFISLGLPDSLLGAAWPAMYPQMQMPVSAAGVLSTIIAGGTILSSLGSARLIDRFGTGKVTAVSVGMTAAALLGFSFSGSFWQLCLWGIPYGLGAGSVDAALNNFVALHYKSRHMSWLHCFWGVGASVGPYIMGLCLSGGKGWQGGYRTIGLLQVVLVAVLLFSLPMWRGIEKSPDKEKEKIIETKVNLRQMPGAVPALVTFFCYCSLEATTGLWASSYFVLHLGVDATTAAGWAAMFYLGITAGRFASGFVTERLGSATMVKAGQITVLLGAVCILLFQNPTGALLGLIIIGLGCAPIYPSLLHETPGNFGEDFSQKMMGMQMASAYVGTTFMPPLFGLLAQYISIRLYPLYLLFFGAGMVVMTARLKTEIAKQQ